MSEINAEVLRLEAAKDFIASLVEFAGELSAKYCAESVRADAFCEQLDALRNKSSLEIKRLRERLDLANAAERRMFNAGCELTNKVACLTKERDEFKASAQVLWEKIEAQNDKFAALPVLPRRPENAQEAMRWLAHYFDGLWGDAGTGEDYVQTDLRRFAEEVDGWVARMNAAEQEVVRLRKGGHMITLEQIIMDIGGDHPLAKIAIEDVRGGNVSQTLLDKTKEWLSGHEYLGLYNDFESCGCGVDDLAPCGCPSLECVAAWCLLCSCGKRHFIPSKNTIKE